ncbi:alpha-amylase [Kineosporia sp. NBRC 101677]|uniref:alpha-amylase n=1 Tax=Kineosporia sp. NBRC 101677 TaxID=3032197 RepID=UPI0024A4D811|nr:alpha-amylase family protein [Kineosporia sp. NBRC 101677]GLY15595.1 alpha-amylase [Kineosporia sp. NBRC 101677]
MTRRKESSARQRRIATVAGATTVLVVGAAATAMAWPQQDSVRAGTQVSTEVSAPAASASAGDVMANLFQWNWASVATECTEVLGPNGFGGVQVAPPQDSIRVNWDHHPWWEVYQPAGYDLNSRMGSEAEFRDMVQTCRDAGVKVYVDAVINHMSGSDMTASGATSYSGNKYSAMTYPGLYMKDDFHQAADCPTSSGDVENYDDVQQAHFCRLGKLEDLKTESDYVRGAITKYLNKLVGYGVSGFRVDAAKHIPRADLKAIIDGLDPTVDGTRPYVALEVFGGQGELSQAAYSELGSVLGLDASVQLKKAFSGNLAALENFGDGLVASDKSLTFVMNHDTDRTGESISSKDAATEKLATQFVLAHDYGVPQVYSSFRWNAYDDAPPSGADGLITDTDCDNDAWNCLDRDPAVLGMVAFRNSVGDAAVTNWSDDGADLISFSRGEAGWTALNNGTSAQTQTFATGLPEGTYCDLTSGGTQDGSCVGTTVKVGADGQASVKVPARAAVAITQDSRL